MSKQPARGDENLKDRLKSFLGISRPTVPKNVHIRTQARDYVFTPDLLKEISPESPANNRIKTIKELCDVLLKKRLKDGAVEALWLSVRDLIQPQVPAENRYVALSFLHCLIEGQYSQLGIMRSHFFHVIEELTKPEDLNYRLDLFNILTENGKDLQYFEEDVGPFLLAWMPEVMRVGKQSDFLKLLVNVIKFNAAYLDEEIVGKLVQNTCVVINQTRTEDDIKYCLDVLDTVVCYSYLPSSSLYHFIASLCRVVNMPKFCEGSWELMRKLLGTHLGHSSIYTMCRILQDRRQPVDSILVRGAVFFIGMALWGSRRVTSLKHTPSSVLPSFKQALPCNNTMVAYEITLSIQRLVKKYGKDLQVSSWDVILDIVEALLKHVESHSSASLDPRMPSELHDILTEVEKLNEQGQFMGSVSRFFHIVELCATKRPESSVIMLVSYHAQSVHPGKENWISNLYNIIDKYFRHEIRTSIRKKALDVLSFVLSTNKHIYEDDLIEKVVLPHLCHIETDPDPQVRMVATEILVCLAQSCSTQRCLDLLMIVEKVLNKSLVATVTVNGPSVGESSELSLPRSEEHLIDTKTAAVQLIDMFKAKLYLMPSTHCLKVYDLLIGHLKKHYDHNYLSVTANSIRQLIMECLLQLRADHLHRLGLPGKKKDGRIWYSPYVVCLTSDTGDKGGPSSPPVGSPTSWSSCRPTIIDYTEAFNLYITCLEKEHDWGVLKLLLEKLPLALQNKTIILSGHQHHVNVICQRLCAMVSDRQSGYPEKFHNLPSKFTRSDFHAYVFPVLACMVSYYNYLDRNGQRDLIECLEFGLVSKCAKVCVNALRLCTLEMQEVMMRLLPSVVLRLSKISATVSMAIPVLAFLSSLVRLPKLYANFVEDQYMSVFAIALPYTNPFKFSHYTVSLAHHVIAMWFIRCRLPFRKEFVKFIHKGLRANVLLKFQENSNSNLQLLNEDSSERGRTSSYNEAALRRKRHPSGPSMSSRLTMAPFVDEKVTQFHIELTETCTDMMSRYTFGNFSTIPKRSPVADFLLTGGQSQTWLLGNKLITVTTSGGGVKPGPQGLCEKCLAVCRSPDTEPVKSVSDTTSNKRRRHRSAACSRSVSTLEPTHVSSQDDINVRGSSKYEDDLHLLDDDNVTPVFAGHDDVGVQTGRSLTDHYNTSETMETYLLNLRGQSSNRPVLPPQLCNCWCTGWAEVCVRSPSGVTSWMMRVQNDPSIFSSTLELSLDDISQLFSPYQGKAKGYDADSMGMIDSESLEEEEYESLYESNFPSVFNDNACKRQESQPFEVDLDRTLEMDPTDSVETMKDCKQESGEDGLVTSVSLRKSNSSPSILGSCDGSSNKDSGSSDNFDITEKISEHTVLQPPTVVKTDTQLLEEIKLNAYLDTEVTMGRISSETSLPAIEEVTSSSKSPEKTLSRPLSTTPEQSPSAFRRLKRTPPKAQPPESEGEQNTHTRRDTTFTIGGEADLPDGNSPSKESLQRSLSHEGDEDVGQHSPPMRKNRGHTIAVMSPAKSEPSESRQKTTPSREPQRGGTSPAHVFLQLYQSSSFHATVERPILLPNTSNINRAMKMLDLIYPYETHKIGVIYVGPGQANDETAILSNLYGSARYVQFLEGLGTLIRLKDIDPNQTYSGGLETGGTDGQFTYSWQDEAMHVMYHVATLMPLKDSDPNCNEKKRHIGNDFVTIVYNESEEEYKIGTIKGQFNYVNIVIKPLDYESNAVTLQAKEVAHYSLTTDIADILGHTDTKIISDANLGLLVRQIAMHCNLASRILQRQNSEPQDPFASNWLERLRQIKRIKTKILNEAKDVTGHDPDARTKGKVTTIEDFTDYV
ncbi:tuberin-like isoform X2 [Liolophura sinensis]|uniref:tuberin-like isoform X2 n=1 Tax=Liolophura sinensis TaxID=3198878 RepID=UPI0031580880